MTQVWRGDAVAAVTRVQAGPCVVVQVKDEKKDGYRAVQVGYGEKKEKNIAKPQRGHMKKVKINLRYLREFRFKHTPGSSPSNAAGRQEGINLNSGDVIDVSAFEAGDKVKVTGISKGKGFQGVVKRHGFSGQKKTHGNKDQLRMPGSSGATGPAHVFKGMRMPGRMGGGKVTISNLEIIKVDKDKNELFIEGAIPGARNGLVLIFGEGELKVASQQKAEIKKEDKQENTKTQKHGDEKTEERGLEEERKNEEN